MSDTPIADDIRAKLGDVVDGDDDLDPGEWFTEPQGTFDDPPGDPVDDPAHPDYVEPAAEAVPASGVPS